MSFNTGFFYGNINNPKVIPNPQTGGGTKAVLKSKHQYLHIGHWLQ